MQIPTTRFVHSPATSPHTRSDISNNTPPQPHRSHKARSSVPSNASKSVRREQRRSCGARGNLCHAHGWPRFAMSA
ncbi:hypothetical protein BC830DRAFT_1101396 [Chytriomyces sp. MP71]|nr:hypothetical protein BC830DRAFT_1101396 [Chytriomyces sp. MP71]